MAHGRLQVNFRAHWYPKHQIISSIEIVFSPLFGKTSGTSCYCKSQVQGVQRHRPCELPAEFWKLKKLSTEEKMADRGQSYPRVTEPGSGAREGGASPELPSPRHHHPRGRGRSVQTDVAGQKGRARKTRQGATNPTQVLPG